MPLVSVKLPASTKAKVVELAARRGLTAHAVMAQAIETAVESADRYDQFVADALQALSTVKHTGQVYDGAEFAAYIRAKANGDASAVKPKTLALTDAIGQSLPCEKT
ncbi:ribbon-helix-helix domain-containing protein [Rhodoferax antarcticus]|uniref:Ribbon-helix-helix, copG family protein n=1 Tax=Rhodoferax antarcticus ANT.BR TaxID=1111071 RepID=A0A1Q8YHM1_9BURK|nr:ribbon-helix-helix protein, CopG family [Rhodoferax antarcticus]APW45269.1 hypothetical protein RA876_01525 [Rhodoferax antarcticus]MCW2311036.1 putative transcriptional regulator [Rhodoferax antarcticus]OLP07554.1 ribbon-helix-helix, copG family protein [Rhodoferax antarcticus ANT.BR]